MALATKPSVSQQRPMRRIWKAPLSKAWWLWLAASIIFYAVIFTWYFSAIKSQQFPGPFNDPFRTFGIIAFVLVFGTASYTLRRRFARNLPGKVQNWLWMHIWVGITAVLIALLHENFAYITHNFCQNASCFTVSYWGPTALYALIFLVASGIIGRLLDVWQAHMIARDASTNGVGIVQAIEERILEMEYTVERLSAGKSEPFKQYCMQALDSAGVLPKVLPALAPKEQADFQRAYETLTIWANLQQSLRRQKRARLIISAWRYIHMVLASVAVLIILFHGVMELLVNVFHVVKPS